jgi:hypothetical protein
MFTLYDTVLGILLDEKQEIFAPSPIEGRHFWGNHS